MVMAEQQSAHRRDVEMRVIKTDNYKSLLGLIFGFLVVCFAFGAGFRLIMAGKSPEGLTSMIGALGLIVISFITAKSKKERDIEEKQGE